MHQSRTGETTEPKAPLPAETVSLPARGFTIDRSKALIAAGVPVDLKCSDGICGVCSSRDKKQ